MRAIPEGQNKAHHDQADVEVFQNDVRDMNPLKIEGGIFHSVRQNNEGDVEISLGRNVGHGRRRIGEECLTRANQEKMRLKTW